MDHLYKSYQKAIRVTLFFIQVTENVSPRLQERISSKCKTHQHDIFQFVQRYLCDTKCSNRHYSSK